MKTIKNFTSGLLLSLVMAAAAFAQAETAYQAPSPSAPTVTVSASAKGVRFVALDGVRQIRLEVFGEGGDSLYNSGFQAGSVLDWNAKDVRGESLPDASYLCVITVRDLSGRLSVKQGGVLVQGGRASLQMNEAGRVAAPELDKSLAPVATDASAAVTLTAHDGSDGQIVSTRGGLSFRTGDFFSGRDRELMYLTPEGNLGLGVAAPQAMLDVAGTIRARGGIKFDDGTVLTSAGTARGGATLSDGSQPTFNVAGTGTANRVTKWMDGSGTLGDSSITETGGNVGIGNAAPQDKLHVSGGGIRVDGNNAQLLSIAPTSAPSVVNGVDIRSGAAGDIRIGAFDSANNFGGAAFQLFSDSNQFFPGNIYFDAGNNPNASLIFRSAGRTIEAMRIAKSGYVGIGTNNPQSKLDVGGDLKVSGNAVVIGNIAAKYQDMAEWVQARGQVVAGTVVVLDWTRANAVIPSAHAYDTHVAGVVSARPGVLLGEGGDGKAMVATTGRVRVKVDASRTPIRIGDLLVTSGRPGVAMRSLPLRLGGVRIHRPGTIIGKALEPLASGEGEILVLLSLQ